ncbi:hypothetical protein JCM9957A_37220 [Kineosporia succinea]
MRSGLFGTVVEPNRCSTVAGNVLSGEDEEDDADAAVVEPPDDEEPQAARAAPLTTETPASSAARRVNWAESRARIGVMNRKVAEGR